MSFSIPINTETAVMEDKYEGLCWIYITAKNLSNMITLVIPITSQTKQSYQREGYHIQSSSLISLIMSRNHCFRTSK